MKASEVWATGASSTKLISTLKSLPVAQNGSLCPKDKPMCYLTEETGSDCRDMNVLKRAL